MKKSIRRARRAVAAKAMPALIAGMIKLLGSTLRIRVEDPDNVAGGEHGPMIWLFWHNRLLVMPVVYKKHLRSRQGSVLTSPSGDGEVLAQVIGKFGVGAIRGSSNKRGAAALREMVKLVRSGCDLCVTPDGPRGPKYRLNPGAVQVAAMTGAPLLPFRVRYDNCWELKTWDAFRIPKPFSKVEVVIGPLQPVENTKDADLFEQRRLEVQTLMVDGEE
ncbi:lysophospholipid acyltransferase family protein [Sulfuriroseicoccus oceanibius]|uniref:Lysophospholipid acyltransferase family protein n=1 Tax=Sulfuriroseicoccus oceanibius TaxID=2707525 RepID=A0A6B3L9K7_9BACT|nr:lysophospholipid acyltransferase family protein [Sulfuriroseicoccus oceanibius]QQL44155.1 lysophospholipid acyltransferase family protein [Sulfuriroseicoccus oceanibius]